MKPLGSEMIFGNWATVLLPLNDDGSIDYGLLSEELSVLINMQVNGIYSNGTAGEFYNLTEAEFDKTAELLASACNAAAMPFQIGCSATNPFICLERVKRAVQLHPGALQVILPDWWCPNNTECMTFLERITNAADPVGIVLYNPPHAKKQLLPSDYATLLQSGIRLAGCKTAGGDDAWYQEMMALVPKLSVFIPGHHLATGISLGAQGAYSNVACIHPGAAQRWYELMKSEMDTALEWQSRIQHFMQECIIPFIHAGYSNQAVDKFMATVGGWCGLKPRLRWPYQSVPETAVMPVRERARAILPEFFEQK